MDDEDLGTLRENLYVSRVAFTAGLDPTSDAAVVRSRR
jgi:hypothetical protein